MCQGHVLGSLEFSVPSKCPIIASNLLSSHFLPSQKVGEAPSVCDFVSWDPGVVLIMSCGFTLVSCGLCLCPLSWAGTSAPHRPMLSSSFHASTQIPSNRLSPSRNSMQSIRGKSIPTYQAGPDYLGSQFGSKWDNFYFLLHL